MSGNQVIFQSPKNLTPNKILRQNKGQLIVEYILLIFIVVSISAILTKSLVGRGQENSGIIITKWGQLLNMIGNDRGD